LGMKAGTMHPHSESAVGSQHNSYHLLPFPSSDFDLRSCPLSTPIFWGLSEKRFIVFTLCAPSYIWVHNNIIEVGSCG
jgi:hypothetical protein